MGTRNGSISPFFFFSLMFSFLSDTAHGGPILDEILRRVDCNVKCASSCAVTFQVDRNLQKYLECTGACRTSCESGHPYGDDGLQPPIDVAPGNPGSGGSAGPGHPYGDDGLGAPQPGQQAPPTMGFGNPGENPAPPPGGEAVCAAIAWWDEAQQKWVGGCNQ